MTPDEFDQKRRELIAMRTKYAGNEAVTNRINNLLGQLEELVRAPASRRETLDKMICRSLKELAELTSQ